MAIKIALAGNPNCGKTTLFNALTGANQYVGNWPGVTVEKKEGKLKGHKDVVIMDLPGIYSLSPYTLEEVVARNYLIGERPDAIINIIDGTNIERNLYLTTQIIELGIPVIMAVNMMDLVTKNGDQINIKALGDALGCEVVEISALKGTGVTKAAEKAVAAAQQKKAVNRVHAFSVDVENCISTVEDKLGSTVAEEQKRFFAIKLIERDSKISDQLSAVPDVSAEINALEEKMDDEEELWKGLKKALDGAIAQFVQTRTVEGENLKKDLIAKLDGMLELVGQIEERAPKIIAEYREKLEGKVKELLEDTQIDEGRIASEIVIFADKICTDEEVVRLRSHVEHMKATLQSDDSGIGRKLDFIAQEMNREANTILSKANDLETSNIGIELKTEIEKVREQIQNIE